MTALDSYASDELLAIVNELLGSDDTWTAQVAAELLPLAARLARLAARLARLEGRLAAIADPVEPPQGWLDALVDRVAALEASLTALDARLPESSLDALVARVGRLERAQ